VPRSTRKPADHEVANALGGLAVKKITYSAEEISNVGCRETGEDEHRDKSDECQCHDSDCHCP
jgi:hypothetical protein